MFISSENNLVLLPASVVIERPMRNMKLQTARVVHFLSCQIYSQDICLIKYLDLLLPLSLGNWSWRMVTTVSVVEIWVPKPSKSSIRKKSTAQTGETGILVTAVTACMTA